MGLHDLSIRLDRKAIGGWIFYDWANSAFATTVMAGFFPVFFKEFWSVGVDTAVSTARLGFANSVAGICVAVAAPVLGAIADRGMSRKRFLLFFACLGSVMTLSLSLISKGEWPMAILVYNLAMMGFAAGNIFYDSLLTAVAPEGRMHFISALGFAAGYLGGGLLFALNVGMALSPKTFGLGDSGEAVRVSFIMAGLWWALFSVPLFIFVKETGRGERRSGPWPVREGLSQLLATFREIRRQRPLFLFLLAYWFYIDGVDTIILMAVDYGISIGFASNELILALLITQFVGFPSAVGFGFLGQRIGARKSIFLAIGIYLAVCLWGTLMTSRIEFYVLAVIIGLVQGGVQALSRSCYAKMIPPERSAEYFGFYNMVGKFAAVMGPVFMGSVGLWVRSMGFGGQVASRAGIASISLFFLVGGMLLWRSREAGRQ